MWNHSLSPSWADKLMTNLTLPAPTRDLLQRCLAIHATHYFDLVQRNPPDAVMHALIDKKSDFRAPDPAAFMEFSSPGLFHDAWLLAQTPVTQSSTIIQPTLLGQPKPKSATYVLNGLCFIHNAGIDDPMYLATIYLSSTGSVVPMGGSTRNDMQIMALDHNHEIPSHRTTTNDERGMIAAHFGLALFLLNEINQGSITLEQYSIDSDYNSLMRERFGLDAHAINLPKLNNSH